MTQKCNIIMDTEFVKEVDDFADSLCISRSALITLALRQYINAYRQSNLMVDMCSALMRIADSAEKGLVPEEQIKELEHFEFIAKTMAQSMAVGAEKSDGQTEPPQAASLS